MNNLLSVWIIKAKKKYSSSLTFEIVKKSSNYLGHADTGVLNGQGLCLPVGGDLDEEILLSLQFGGVGKGLITDFIQSI